MINLIYQKDGKGPERVLDAGSDDADHALVPVLSVEHEHPLPDDIVKPILHYSLFTIHYLYTFIARSISRRSSFSFNV